MWWVNYRWLVEILTEANLHRMKSSDRRMHQVSWYRNSYGAMSFIIKYRTAVYLSSVVKLPKDKKVYVIGEKGIEEELEEEGFQHLGGTVSLASPQFILSVFDTIS